VEACFRNRRLEEEKRVIFLDRSVFYSLVDRACQSTAKAIADFVALGYG
jgi:hypothetical protein